jgi:hypothetical protein
MGYLLSCGKNVLVLALAAGAISAGCHTGPTVATQKLARYQQTVGTEGLDDVQPLAPLKVTAAPPEDWVALKMYQGPLYTHQQWRSPSKATGVGVVYIKLPLPLPMGTLVWFAKQEYTKKASEGKLLAEWTDSFGRRWFEAENNKYHVKGYAIVQGTDAWIVYSGFRMAMDPRPEEIALAERCQEMVLIQPKPGAPRPDVAQADARD